MASEPLIDFDALDLTRVLVPKSEIYAVLRQRGKFEVLDGILHYGEEKSLAIAFSEIRASDWWTTDHIPGRPIYPGALMIEAGAQTCAYDFMRRQNLDPDVFVGFGGLEHTRFRGVVTPGSRMIFAAAVHRIRSRMFSYHVQGFVERDLVFETDVLGVVV